MPNSIDQDQKSQNYLELLASSTQVYRGLGRISMAQTGLAITAAGLGPLLTWIDPTLKVWGALFGIAVLLFDWFLFDPWMKSRKLIGTKIQECFDTGLFKLPWNELKCGPPPDPAVINELIRDYKHRDPTLLLVDKEWYPTDLGPVRLPYARLICQWSNLRWDGDLRRIHAWILIVALILYALLGIVWGLANKWSLETFVLSFLVPGLPVARRIGENSKKQFDSANEADRFFAYITKVWNDAMGADGADEARLEAESRRIQDELFERRKTTIRVPDLLHKYLRPRFQAKMAFNAQQALAQVIANPRIHP